VRRLFLHRLAGPRAGGLTDQVVALGDVRGPTGGIRVGFAGLFYGRNLSVRKPGDLLRRVTRDHLITGLAGGASSWLP
jgi:hypothetical protein